MIEILILTAALGCTEVTEVPVIAIVAAPVRVLADVQPVRRLVKARPARRLLTAVAARKPARRFLGRVANRVRERPRLRAARRFVTGR